MTQYSLRSVWAPARFLALCVLAIATMFLVTNEAKAAASFTESAGSVSANTVHLHGQDLNLGRYVKIAIAAPRLETLIFYRPGCGCGTNPEDITINWNDEEISITSESLGGKWVKNVLLQSQKGIGITGTTTINYKFVPYMLIPTEDPVEVEPENTVAPSISGTPEVGETLTCNNGTWTGTTPINYTYKWKRDGNDIGSATSQTYLLVGADEGAMITCEVTGTNGVGNDIGLSGAVGPVTSGMVAPENVVAPALTGTAQVGETLSCGSGTWTGTEPVVLTYKWKRNGNNISGATSNTYLLVGADEAASITCEVTGTNDAGNDVALSNSLGPVLPAEPASISGVVITGTGAVGSTLTCNPGTWAGNPTLTYEWLNEGTPISGEDGTTYVVDISDVGDELTCRVTGVNTSGMASATSNAIVGSEELEEITSVEEDVMEFQDSGSMYQMAMGNFEACALNDDNQIFCWQGGYASGDNFAFGGRKTPRLVHDRDGLMTGKTITSISTAPYVESYVTSDGGSWFYHISGCAIADGEAYCWKSVNDPDNQYTNDSVADPFINVLDKVDTSGALSGKTLVQLAEKMPCALATDDNMYCWDSVTLSNVDTYTDPDLIDFMMASGGAFGGSLGGVYESGVNALDGLISDLENGAAPFTSGCIAKSGAAHCWSPASPGFGAHSLLDSEDHVAVPTPVTSGSLNGKTVSFAVGGNDRGGTSVGLACAIDTDGGISCWGGHGSTILGDGNSTGSPVPVAVDTSAMGAETPIDITVTAGQICAITDAGKMYCWGRVIDNADWTRTQEVLTPVEVSTTNHMTALEDVSGLEFTDMFSGNTGASGQMCALADNGALYCQTENDYFGTVGTRHAGNPTIWTESSSEALPLVKVGSDYRPGLLTMTQNEEGNGGPSSRSLAWGNTQNVQVDYWTCTLVGHYSGDIPVDCGSDLDIELTDLPANDYYRFEVAAYNQYGNFNCYGYGFSGTSCLGGQETDSPQAIFHTFTGEPIDYDVTHNIADLNNAPTSGNEITIAYTGVLETSEAYCYLSGPDGTIGDGSCPNLGDDPLTLNADDLVPGEYTLSITAQVCDPDCWSWENILWVYNPQSLATLTFYVPYPEPFIMLGPWSSMSAWAANEDPHMYPFEMRVTTGDIANLELTCSLEGDVSGPVNVDALCPTWGDGSDTGEALPPGLGQRDIPVDLSSLELTTGERYVFTVEAENSIGSDTMTAWFYAVEDASEEGLAAYSVDSDVDDLNNAPSSFTINISDTGSLVRAFNNPDLAPGEISGYEYCYIQNLDDWTQYNYTNEDGSCSRELEIDSLPPGSYQFIIDGGACLASTCGSAAYAYDDSFMFTIVEQPMELEWVTLPDETNASTTPSFSWNNVHNTPANMAYGYPLQNCSLEWDTGATQLDVLDEDYWTYYCLEDSLQDMVEILTNQGSSVVVDGEMLKKTYTLTLSVYDNDWNEHRISYEFTVGDGSDNLPNETLDVSYDAGNEEIVLTSPGGHLQDDDSITIYYSASAFAPAEWYYTNAGDHTFVSANEIRIANNGNGWPTDPDGAQFIMSAEITPNSGPHVGWAISWASFAENPLDLTGSWTPIGLSASLSTDQSDYIDLGYAANALDPILDKNTPLRAVITTDTMTAEEIAQGSAYYELWSSPPSLEDSGYCEALCSLTEDRIYLHPAVMLDNLMGNWSDIDSNYYTDYYIPGYGDVGNLTSVKILNRENNVVLAEWDGTLAIPGIDYEYSGGDLIITSNLAGSPSFDEDYTSIYVNVDGSEEPGYIAGQDIANNVYPTASISKLGNVITIHNFDDIVAYHDSNGWNGYHMGSFSGTADAVIGTSLYYVSGSGASPMQVHSTKRLPRAFDTDGEGWYWLTSLPLPDTTYAPLS